MALADDYRRALSWPAGTERPKRPTPVHAQPESSGGYWYVALVFADGSTYCNPMGRPYVRLRGCARACARLTQEDFQ